MARSIAPSAKQTGAKIWLTVTILGVVLYVIIDVVLAFLRPDYSWLHNAESDYGRGPYFWIMDINFLLRCLFSLTLAKAFFVRFPKNKLVKQAGAWLIAWAVASGLLAFFADTPHGYTKLWSGGFHLAIAFVAFIAAVVAMVAFRRLATVVQLSETTAYGLTILTGIALVSLILLGHSGFRPHSLGGLYERVFLASVLAWEVVLALAVRANDQARR